MTASNREIELAWAAGFFDGEGSTFINHQKQVARPSRPGSKPSDVISPCLSVAQVELQPLARFASAVDGRVPSGPYTPKNPNAQQYYRWDASGRPSVCRILTLLWPYLSEPKRAQARKCWAEMVLLKRPKSPALPDLPENPA
jgi:hypothetical protein